LTELPNRRMLGDRLIRAQNRSVRQNRFGALLCIDGDHFKKLNDTMGHEVGDQVLVQLAGRLKSCVRDIDTVARIGADQFAIIVDEFEERDVAASHAENLAHSILREVQRPMSLQFVDKEGRHALHEYECTVSIGLALFGEANIPVEELLKWAESAMYQVKSSARNGLRFHDPAMQAISEARLALEIDLRRALKNQEFLLYYQPQFHASGKIIGSECLVRWKHPRRGMISPVDFIPIAEESGLIVPIGQWVLDTSCEQLAIWAGAPETAALTLSVNVSAKQFALSNFVDCVKETISRTGANANLLKLEITESVLLVNAEEIIAKIIALKDLGVRFALDDFGTGYSSLAYLRQLPVDQLKIDKAFVRDVLTNPHDAAIACVIVTLGSSLGIEVIAEGVEQQGQKEFLEKNGCLSYQGYLFSRPVPIEEFKALIQNHMPA